MQKGRLKEKMDGWRGRRREDLAFLFSSLITGNALNIYRKMCGCLVMETEIVKSKSVYEAYCNYLGLYMKTNSSGHLQITHCAEALVPK